MNGGKIKVCVRLTGRHRGRCAAAQTDIHGRTAQDDKFSAHDDLAFLDVIGANIADPTRQHDRFVIPAQLFAIMAIDFFFIGTEVAVQRRTSKFVVKGCATQWAFSHDIKRGDNAIRLAEIFFPRLFKARNTQV
ncbi:hypothetical protein D3C78_779210 [compost metagenome]